MQSLFARKRPAMTMAAPDGAAIYAIGDIHGCSDLAAAMIELIDRDPRRGLDGLHVVGLGDYIDRGPDSPGVLDLLVALKARRDLHVHLLLGNHDKSLLDFLADATVGPAWAQNGGRETLTAYGVEAPWASTHEAGWEQARLALVRSIPQAHVDLLQSLELSVSIGGYFFVHAGVKPGVPLFAQDPTDLLWIRKAFLESRERHDQVIVHGHTPTTSPYADERRVGVDTGGYATGVLTAVRLEGDRRRFVQVRRGPLVAPSEAIGDAAVGAPV